MTLPYLIVGAGPFGLAAARALKRKDIPFEVVERHSRVGGIWDIDNPGSPMYETCHFITSKINGGYIDYPMNDDYPTYPSWRQVLTYIESMSRDFGLDEHIRFNTTVTSARPTSEGLTTTWMVDTSEGHLGEYRGIIYAGGQQWAPYLPDISGMNDFTGRLIHSSEYKLPVEFADKRVLVIGAGNSGVDIVVDAAEYGSHAVLSTRRPYYFLPKQIFGVPTPDLLVGKIALPDVANVPNNLNPMQVVDLVLGAVGPLESYGLETPDWPLGATQPIVSDLALHHFSHGTLKHKPDVARITPTGVEFVDGTTDEFDVIVVATGFDISIDWLDESVLDPNDGHPEFLLGALSTRFETLYAMGVIHPSRADAWALFDQLGHIIVADILARDCGINVEGIRRLRTEYRPNLKGDFPFLQTRRNANQADTVALENMLNTLRATYGLEIPTAKQAGFFTAARAMAN